MTDTSHSPSTPAPPTSTVPSNASYLDWLYVYGLMLKDMASNAGAALVAKVRKWSPLAQISTTLALVVVFAWLLGALHWPTHETFATPASVDAKIKTAKAEMQSSIEKRTDALTDVVAKLPTADTVARTTAGKAEMAQMKADLEDLMARVKTLEGKVAAFPAKQSRKRR